MRLVLVRLCKISVVHAQVKQRELVQRGLDELAEDRRIQEDMMAAFERRREAALDAARRAANATVDAALTRLSEEVEKYREPGAPLPDNPSRLYVALEIKAASLVEASLAAMEKAKMALEAPLMVRKMAERDALARKELEEAGLWVEPEELDATDDLYWKELGKKLAHAEAEKVTPVWSCALSL